MARNYEKNFSRLNRYHLAKNEDKKKRDNSRPYLRSLSTVEEVKKWIPSIKKEIDYCLRQIECATRRNYSEQQVEEFEKRIKTLEREHGSFVRKVFQLDPDTKGIPWQGREYNPKRLKVRQLSRDATLQSKLLTERQERSQQLSEESTAIPLENSSAVCISRTFIKQAPPEKDQRGSNVTVMSMTSTTGGKGVALSSAHGSAHCQDGLSENRLCVCNSEVTQEREGALNLGYSSSSTEENGNNE